MSPLINESKNPVPVCEYHPEKKESFSNFLTLTNKRIKAPSNNWLDPVEDVNCLEPVLIVNPRLREFVHYCDLFCIDGREITITPDQRSRIMSFDNPAAVLGVPFAHVPDKNHFSEKDWPFVEKRFLDFVAGSFLVNRVTGESYPVYVFVPCGKCDVCQSKKVSGIVQRCQMAYEESRQDMLFITLTYNQASCPSDMNARLRDIQLFKKRFKRAASRLYYDMLPVSKENELNPPPDPSSKIKFCVVSEHGDTGRIHYHMLIFGCPKFTFSRPSNRYYTIKLCQYCWREPELHDNGFGYVTFNEYRKKYPNYYKLKPDYDPLSKGFVNFTMTGDKIDKSGKVLSPSRAVNYICKYITKKVDTSEDDFKELFCISTKMGLEFVQSKIKELLDPAKNGIFEYVSFAGGRPKKVHLTGYYIKKLFPGFTDLIPVSFRKDFYSAMRLADEMISSGQFSSNQCNAILKTKLFILSKFDFMQLMDYYSDKKEIIKAPTKVFIDNMREQCILEFGLICGRLLDYEFDYDSILARLRYRDEYFAILSKQKKRSSGQLRLSGRDFVKNQKVLQSKSVLL